MTAESATDKASEENKEEQEDGPTKNEYKAYNTNALLVVGAVGLLVLLFTGIIILAINSYHRMRDPHTEPASSSTEVVTDTPRPDHYTKIVCVYRFRNVTDVANAREFTASCDKIVIFLPRSRDKTVLDLGASVILKDFKRENLYMNIYWKEASQLDRDRLREIANSFVHKDGRYSLAFVPAGELSSPAVKAFVEVFQKRQENGDLALALGVVFSDPIIATEQQSVISVLDEISGSFDFIMMNLKASDASGSPCVVFPRWKSPAVLSLYKWANESLTAPPAAMATAAVYRVNEEKAGEDCVTDAIVGRKETLTCSGPTEGPVFTTASNKTFATETTQTLAEMWKAYRNADVQMVFIDRLELFHLPKGCVTRSLSDYVP